MATRVESVRNLVDVQSIALIRPINLSLTLSAARPLTAMNIFFDNVQVNHLCAPAGGNIGDDLITDSNGSLSCVLYIPGGTFTTGTKTIFITDAGSIADATILGSTFGSATGTFSSNGTLQFFQRTTTTITTIEVVEVRTSWDPLAQSFFTYGITGGIFLTSIDLYFNTKDPTIPVRLDIRRLVNGYPEKFSSKNPDMIVTLNPSQVNTSANATAATRFTFNRPIFLEENSDYCFVVFSNSKLYNMFTSKLGETAFETGKTIFDQPYVGSLFKSENDITWTAEQFEDIKFKLNVAKFDNTSAAQVEFTVLPNYFAVPGTSFTTTTGSSTVRVRMNSKHGLETTSIVDVIAQPNAVYNGVSSTNISGERSVTSIVDEFTFEYSAGSSATSTGQIKTGGQVVHTVITNGGSGYTTAPTITFVGGGASTAAQGTARLQNGAVIAIDITNPGVGYTVDPTITLTGGDGTGAAASAYTDAVFSVLTNKPVNFIQPNIPAREIVGTKINATISATQLNYPGGNLVTYQAGETLDMNIRGRTMFNINSMIASNANQIAKMGGNDSMKITYTMTSENPYLSPILDVKSNPSVLAYSYRLSNQDGEDLTSSTSTGVVSQIILSNAGSGYTVAPAITLLGGAGSGATAAAVLGSTAVSGVTVSAGGSGYTSAPVVSFTGGGGTGATAVAILEGTSIASISVTSGGSGYTSAPTIVFSGGGGGSGALATAVLTTVGVATVTVDSGGTGYTTAPTVAFSGGGGSGAAGTAVLNAVGVASVTVTNGGTGYTTATISFSGGDGTGATATATIDAGVITAINVTNPGTGYTSAPTVGITGDGSGATATAVLQTRSIASVTVTNAGSGYSSAPTVAFSGGGGSGASATAVLQTRSVASVTLDNGGSGYTVAPSILFSGGGGTGAAATATLSPRAVASVTVTNGGAGYTTAPTVAFSGGGGSGATATASIAGKSIQEIIVLTPGSSYASPPEVVITRTDGSTGVDAIAESVLTTFNSELSADRGTAQSRYVTRKFSLATPSKGLNLFSEIYSEQESSVDWYIRTSLSGAGIDHETLEWKILSCDVDRNASTRRGQFFDYKFYLYDLSEFDTYDLKCVLRSSNPAKAPEVNNYRVIIVA